LAVLGDGGHDFTVSCPVATARGGTGRPHAEQWPCLLFASPPQV